MNLRIRQISESEFTVQGHGVHTAYIELTRALKQYRGTKVLVNHRGPADITHIHTIGLYSLWYMVFGSGKKVVSAHVVPASFVGSLIGTKYWLSLAKIYVRWFYNRADLVLAVSGETKKELVKLGVKRPIEVLYNMVDTARYRPALGAKKAARKKLSLGLHDWIVMGAGQVQPRKRVDSFVATARALPDTTFVWVGGMPFGKMAADNQAMQTMIDEAPKNVIFPGIVPLDTIKDYYQAADVFFLPSEQETFGLVVIEAAAAGLPVVLRDIAEYDDTFGSNAWRCEEDQFADAIKTLRDDKTTYKTWRQKSAKIAKRFDSHKVLEQLMMLYRRLL